MEKETLFLKISLDFKNEGVNQMQDGGAHESPILSVFYKLFIQN